MKQYVPYQVPPDVDSRLTDFQRRVAAERGLPLTKFTKSGATLRYVLALATAAEALGIRPATEQQIEA